MVAGRVERDRVHPDAELLNQLQFRRRGDEFARHRSQDMEQRGDLARHSVERFGLVDMHDDARTEDRIDRVTETRARAGVEDDHAATRPIEPAKARSEEHTSELQSLSRILYSIFCLK